jgi:hypothetical protein
VSSTGASVNYAKFFDLAQNQTTPGTCQDDIVFALPLGGPTAVFTTCNALAVQAHAPFLSSVSVGQWYHLVAVVLQPAGATTATYLTYTDGVLYTNMSGQPLLAASLARSPTWPAPTGLGTTTSTARSTPSTSTT